MNSQSAKGERENGIQAKVGWNEDFPRSRQDCYHARMQIRASLKMVKLGYILCLLLAAAIAVYLLAIHNEDPKMWGLLVVPAILMIFVMIRQIRRRLTKLIILNDRLRYESGLFSKTTRTVELAKVQDVRVDQTLSQRMLKIGDLSLETAGGTSRIVILSIDRPQEAADHILELSKALHSGAGLDGFRARDVPRAGGVPGS
jgi:membrane protein YdbS with pleckstrin-like domain